MKVSKGFSQELEVSPAALKDTLINEKYLRVIFPIDGEIVIGIIQKVNVVQNILEVVYSGFGGMDKVHINILEGVKVESTEEILYLYLTVPQLYYNPNVPDCETQVIKFLK